MYFVKSEVEGALQTTATEVLKLCSFFPPSSVAGAGAFEVLLSAYIDPVLKHY